MTRELIIKELKNHTNNIPNLSQKMGLSVARIEEDLEHIRTTLRNDPNHVLKIQPPHCKLCDYQFQNDKIKTPSKCPSCGRSKIKPASFKIEKKK